MENKLSELVDIVMHGKGDSDKHTLTLFSIALSINAKNILELGVRDGASTKPLLLAAHMLGGSLTSVDIEDTSFKPDANMQNNWNFIKSDALEYLDDATKAGKVYDLIYVDDWHAYQHVKRELEYIDMLTKPSGVILLHDLMYGETCPFYHVDLTKCSPQWSEGGPYRAVAELDENFWEFSTIPSNNGLTLLRKKYSSKFQNN